MAAVLKHWREASTLILVCRATGGPKIVTPKSTTSKKPKTDFDYRILMLKRSGKSKFMPSAYVFPGGVASDADFSPEWLDLYQRLCDTDLWDWPTAVEAAKKMGSHKISPMLTRQREPQYSHTPADIAFRICAIREAFEESGVLLVRSAGSSESTKLSEAVTRFSKELPVTASLCAKLDKSNLSEWRQRVEKDPGEFINLCKTNNFIPDIWSLYSWSNWLTPTASSIMTIAAKKPRRFDTAFYLSVLDEMPDFVEHDSGETVQTQWATPAEVLQSYRAEAYWIAPPQLYELARLIQFSSATDILDFVNQRARYHMERWLPIQRIAEDGFLQVFPGDCLYPANPDLVEKNEEPLEQTVAELRNASPQNRMELHSRFDIRLMCDMDQSPEHISPLSDTELASLDTSQPTAKL